MITQVDLKNYRLFSKFNIKLKKGLNILVGPNGVGKTSIIEAIYLASTTKSFRTNYSESLIKKNESQMIVEVKTDVNTYSLYFENNKKFYKINNSMYTKAKDYIGGFKTVIFSLDDLKLIDGAKGERRRFLDIEISLQDKKYLVDLTKYKKIIEERNEVLKSPKIDEIYLGVLNSAMVDLTKNIYKARVEFIDDLNFKLKKLCDEIGFKEIKLEYHSTYDPNDILKALNEKKESDIKARSTQIGPHRDDFKIKMADLEAFEYASVGQKRLIVILIKLALKEILEEKNELILLLDDVFATLDKDRIRDVTQYIIGAKQTIITTTSVNEIPNELLVDSNIIDVEG